jgi:hypothetical protein
VAVAFDATANTSGVGVSSLTFAHTCTGSSLLLVVGVTWTDTSISGASLTGITYNGVAMTQLKTLMAGIATDEVWYLIAPATGAHNVVVTFTNVNPLEAPSTTAVAGSISWTGVDQVTPLGTPVTATATSTAPSVTLTGVSASNFVFDSLDVASAGSTQPTITVNASQIQRWQTKVGGAGSRIAGAGSTKASAVGSVTMSWTLSASRTWGTIAVEVLQVSVVSTTPLRTLLGVGL